MKSMLRGICKHHFKNSCSVKDGLLGCLEAKAHADPVLDVDAPGLDIEPEIGAALSEESDRQEVAVVQSSEASLVAAEVEHPPRGTVGNRFGDPVLRCSLAAVYLDRERVHPAARLRVAIILGAGRGGTDLEDQDLL